MQGDLRLARLRVLACDTRAGHVGFAFDGEPKATAADAASGIEDAIALWHAHAVREHSIQVEVTACGAQADASEYRGASWGVNTRNSTAPARIR